MSEHSVKGDRLPEALLRVAAIACLFLLIGVVTVSVASEKKGTQTIAKKPSSTVAVPRALPLLVDVGADKCIPCIMMAPILEDLKSEYAGVLQVKFVDAWKDPVEARRYGVRGIPTQIFYDASGRELNRHFGFISKEDILKAFEDLGVPLKKRVWK